MAREWSCLNPACRAILGALNTDRDGRDALHCRPVVVRLDFFTDRTDVHCSRCGMVKAFTDGRVIPPRRGRVDAMT